MWPMRILRDLRKVRKGPYLFGLATIGLAFSLFSLFLLSVENLQRMLSLWQRGVEIVCYLEPGLDESQVERVLEAMRRTEGIGELRYLPPERVKEELLTEMGGLLEGLEPLQEELFPPTVEVKLKSPLSLEGLRSLAQRLKAIRGVKDAQYGGRWLQRALDLIGFLKASTWAVGAVLFCVTLLISANTLKLVFYERKEEIEILRLVGATEGFIRTPFVIEGAMQGLLGAILALLVAGALFGLIQGRIPSWLMPYLPEVRFLSVRSTLVLLGMGILSGIIGGLLSCLEQGQ